MVRNSEKKGLKTLVVPLLICADEVIPLVVDMSMDTIRECEKLVHKVCKSLQRHVLFSCINRSLPSEDINVN